MNTSSLICQSLQYSVQTPYPGGYTVVSTKATSSLLNADFYNIFGHYITYLLLLILVSTAVVLTFLILAPDKIPEPSIKQIRQRSSHTDQLCIIHYIIYIRVIYNVPRHATHLKHGTFRCAFNVYRRDTNHIS
jgi:hypothetical protein